jgi:hypothetical protein
MHQFNKPYALHKFITHFGNPHSTDFQFVQYGSQQPLKHFWYQYFKSCELLNSIELQNIVLTHSFLLKSTLFYKMHFGLCA